VIRVYHTGVNSYAASMILTTLCVVDVTHFPYDTQNVVFRFGSWRHDVSEVNILSDNVDVLPDVYVKNLEWHVTNISFRREEIKVLLSLCKYLK
jgi:hypothetical protein